MPQENESKSREEIAAEIEDAKSDGKKSAQKEAFDRTTVVAFGLLFVLPALIIVLSLLFFLPFIARNVNSEPSNAPTVRTGS